MNHQTLIEAHNLAFAINGNKLFHNLSFSLTNGEAMHITGDNGSGKSTLIRIILGITNQTRGNVENNLSKCIAYLGHKNAVKNYLTLEDNLILMELKEHKDLKKYLEILNLKKYSDVIVANLSFGQQKKLALLRIFLNNSELIVLDEPFVGLDKQTQKILSEFLNNELGKKKSIIYTSHIPCEIESKVLNIM
jgi:heme exporter protein A